MKKDKILLKDHIYISLVKRLIAAAILVALLSVAVYGITGSITARSVSDILFRRTSHEIETALRSETQLIEKELDEISRVLLLFQAEESQFFRDLDSLPSPPTSDLFAIHTNGAFYKIIDNDGGGLYYSADTAIGPREYKKAYYTERFDSRYTTFVKTNDLVAQVYINTYDNMNRIYPMIDNVPEQFGPTFYMEDYNFYYLADNVHNPERTPVWTNAYLDPAGLGWMVSCVVPIYNNDFLEGVTGADITLDLIIKELLSMTLPTESGVFITDGNGDIIAMNSMIEELFNLDELKTHTYDSTIDYTIYKPDDYNLANIDLSEEENKLLGLLVSSQNQTTISCNDHTYHIQKDIIRNTNWHVFTVSDINLLYADILKVEAFINWMMLLVIVLAMLFVVIFIFIFNHQSKSIAKSISEPIDQLRRATEKIGNELESTTLSQDGVHIIEIKALNDQFNTMIKELNRRTKALLSKEVEQRLQKKLTEKYKNEAITDTLTQIHNRRKIDDVISEELNRSSLQEQPLSLILVDLDNFKDINDRLGHSVGDDVLVAFSKLLKEHIRSTDFVGRWGGEEFLVICPFTDSQGAKQLAEKLRHALEEKDFEIGYQITASFGVAQYHGQDKRTFFNRVDAAMYQAKSLSKNTVVVYDDETED